MRRGQVLSLAVWHDRLREMEPGPFRSVAALGHPFREHSAYPEHRFYAGLALQMHLL